MLLVKNRVFVMAFLVSLRLSEGSSDSIRIGYITGSEKPHPKSMYKRPGINISGALTLAVNEINNDSNILPNHTLEFTVKETYGKELNSVRHACDLSTNESISAIIGPQETCIFEAKVAAAYNVPMVSYFCTQKEVADKALYPTFVRTKPQDWVISSSVTSVLKYFNWKKVAFIHRDQAAFAHIAKTIVQVRRKIEINMPNSN
ncbi:receptor-type guanylate cyclase Gyc76C-like [Lingula anatina]|uniref:Receptor-type guanylate cyclase Gyc76C-like n=1 Tax=Lingula anatina TaxID=7574 RepID=A0A2R2MS70_LINAN|nr:receptor-type guanylate cyclase Gyc76C-like [Lingula anatina]|eukprot:XP_023933111.1 receptor-type guanylate cyclase Gyc76C-like [Lingula anatina]